MEEALSINDTNDWPHVVAEGYDSEASFYFLQIDTHIFEPQGISELETESTFITNELNNALTKVQNETKVCITWTTRLSMLLKKNKNHQPSYASLTDCLLLWLIFRPTFHLNQP